MSPTDQGKLSKEEVEALLHATMEEEAGPERREPARRVQSYDFLQPSRFNRAALEKLRRINEELAARTAAFASTSLRSNVKAQLASMDQMKWEHLTREAGPSTVAFVFHLAPAGHAGILAIDAPFAGACVERMMGGQGDLPEGTPEFSEIDIAVLRRFAAGFIAPLPELWARIGPFEVEVDRFVQDLAGLDLFAPGRDFFQVSYVLQTGSGSGQIVISVPFEAVHDLPPDAESEQEAAAVETDRTSQAGMIRALEHVDVDVRVLLGNADIKVARLVNVEAGDVIVLDTQIGEALSVEVGGQAKLRGFPGVSSGKYAVKILMED